MMKALSIRQPWAWLIVNGYKDIENRTWKTKLKGKFYIHAGKKIDIVAYTELSEKYKLPSVDNIKTGGIVGQAEITDCVSSSESKWFHGPFGFVIRNPQELPFAPCRGYLSFFRPCHL